MQLEDGAEPLLQLRSPNRELKHGGGCCCNLLKMRKYSKLTLVIVTVVSLICFLFYKVQYDKLYNVLQVLEFFGNANQPPASGAGGVTQSFDQHVLSGLLPSWQYVTPELFIYSAFCVKDKGQDCVRVTALMAATERAAVASDLGCQLWYEGTVRPVTGISAASGLLHEEGHGSTALKPYILTCESKFPSMVPFGLSITLGRIDGFVHVTVPKVPPAEERLPKDDLALKAAGKAAAVVDNRIKAMVACIGPQQTHEDSTQLLTEQILIQNFFQIDNFVVYDSGLTNKFMSTISAASSKKDSKDKKAAAAADLDDDLEVDILPWNAPPGLDKAASRILVKTDCHYRTRNTYRSSVFLDIGQILVLRSDQENFLENAMKRLAGEGGGGAKLDVQVRKFCAEAPLDEPSAAIEYAIDAIRKSRYDAAKSSLQPPVSVMFNVSGGGGSVGVVNVAENDLLIHDYGSCQDFDMDDTSNEKVDEFLVSHAKQIQLKLGKYFSKIQD